MGTRVEIGYTLSSEERQPSELVRLARLAEDIGFTYALPDMRQDMLEEAVDILRTLRPQSWQHG